MNTRPASAAAGPSSSSPATPAPASFSSATPSRPLSSMWYVMAPTEVTGGHPIARAQERERARAKEESERRHVLDSIAAAAGGDERPTSAVGGAGGSSFARLSGLPSASPSSSASAKAAASSANPQPTTSGGLEALLLTDGSGVPAAEAYSPFPAGGFFALPSEAAVCELVLQWFEDKELLRRRRAALVVVPNPSFDPSIAASTGGGGNNNNTNSRTMEEIRVEFPTVIEYDDVNVINFVEASLRSIVVMEPVGANANTIGGGPSSASGLRPPTSAAAATAPKRVGIGAGAADDSPYIFHGHAWVAAALTRHFQRYAVPDGQEDAHQAGYV